jgi:starch phosphorylase
VDPETIFDCQIKRIHEYKRQLLNALRIVVTYNRLRANPKLDVPPRTFFFAGEAAPAYQLAKLIIKFINNMATPLTQIRRWPAASRSCSCLTTAFHSQNG